MSLPFTAITIFAEDVREEATGMMTMVGILPDNLAVPGFPGAIPKLAVYTRMHIPLDVEVGDLRVMFRFPDGTERQISVFDTEFIREARGNAVDRGRPHFGIVSQAIASPFPVLSPGTIEVLVRSDNSESVTGFLNLHLAENEDAVSSPE